MPLVLVRVAENIPNSPDENSVKSKPQDYRAGLASIFSQLFVDGRLTVVDNLCLDTLKQGIAQKMKDMGMGWMRSYYYRQYG